MEDQELKFACKLCFKKYPCGKSLGGHMRSHVVANSAESDENFDANLNKFSSFSGGVDPKFAEIVNGQSSYGLRENPRKTWRAVDSTFPLPQEKICKQCGKGFHSLKALCGHMVCHSEKDKRGLKDDHSWSASEKLSDSHSDTKCDDRVIGARSSKGKRFAKIVIKSPFCLSNNNGSSSVSEVDGEDQEEVAMCLMLLSRDSCNSKGGGGGGGVNSVVESSDKNSVVLEAKSSSIDMRTRKRDALKNVLDQEEILIPPMKKIGEVKLKQSVFYAEFENSDSGYYLDECTNVSVDRFRETLNRGKSCRGERKKQLAKGSDESRKRMYITENGEDCNGAQKRVKYECFNCKKTFKSYQALGGHRPCHKKSNAYNEYSQEGSTEFTAKGKLVESTSNRISSGKNSSEKKGHVCPFCNRVFRNGQALGGHKRSHFIGRHVVNHDLGPITKPDFLDLNLPAPQEDDDDGNDQL